MNNVDSVCRIHTCLVHVLFSLLRLLKLVVFCRDLVNIRENLSQVFVNYVSLVELILLTIPLHNCLLCITKKNSVSYELRCLHCTRNHVYFLKRIRLFHGSLREHEMGQSVSHHNSAFCARGLRKCFSTSHRRCDILMSSLHLSVMITTCNACHKPRGFHCRASNVVQLRVVCSCG